MLSENAPDAYQEFLDKEKEKMIVKVQKDCVYSAIKNHFPRVMREHARVFAIELSKDLSELFGKEVKPCEIYDHLNAWGQPFSNLEVEDEDADE